MSMPCPISLPRWGRIGIALACIGIGIASSAVAGWLLVRGLELTEPDDKARMILTAAGVLMIMTELVAFFITALLPTARLYQLRAMGIALLVFEITTIYGTRLVLSDSAESAAVAHATRTENLQLAIDNRKADADRVRAAGERQATSDHAWARHLGTLAIQKADMMEREIEPLREALADLQGSGRPTLQHALGPQLAQVHSIAMPVLVSSTGLVLFGVAGLMLRRTESGDAVPAHAVPVHRTAVPRGAVPAVPQVVSPLHHWRSITAAVPLAAVSVAPAAIASTVAESPVESPEPTAAVRCAQDTGTAEDDRYQRLRTAVLAGEVKPSVRSIREAGYGGTDAVRRHLQQLASDGVIVKSGQGYIMATKQHEVQT